MMEHIRQFDWCSTSAPSRYFVDEATLDNCNTEKLIRNKFFDPLASDDEEEHEPNVIDWDSVFKDYEERNHKIYVPGLRPIPPYHKLSVLTGKQHYQLLKVICAKYPNVLKEQLMYKPTAFDVHTFEVLKDVYETEQKEFIEWAKTLWVSHHCIRALRPKPMIETVYEAEFKMRAQRLSGFPKTFDMAAQIPLECTRGYQYDVQLMETLIAVDISELPLVEIPQQLSRDSTIIKPYTLPEPCHKHPYQLILPTESSVSLLPITEIHRELANYAAERGTKFIASENAVRCLVELNRDWTIPLTVCQAYTPEGESCNVVVLDSEFSIHKETAVTRTYRAFKHLLERTLIPTTELEKALERNKKKVRESTKQKHTARPVSPQYQDDGASSDDETTGLVIFEPPTNDDNDDNDSYLKDSHMNDNWDQQSRHSEVPGSPVHTIETIAKADMSLEDINDIIGVYSCSCADSLYEFPPRRSYKKWRVRNKNTLENLDVIIHSAHKARNSTSEVVMEVIPEYQLELGASEQPPDKLRSIALALMLRDNAQLVTVRVDGCNGDIVTIDTTDTEQFLREHEAKLQQVHNILHTALSELQALLPGQYLLQHNPSHGFNAFLHVSRPQGTSVSLEFDVTQLADSDEAKLAKTPPTIVPVLMPHHKFRKILPCAFTPFENNLAKDQKKPPARQKQPPQAIKWPKKQKGKKKKK